MPKTQPALSPTPLEAAEMPAVERRVDGPHSLHGSPAAPPVVADDERDFAAEQLQHHAEQLGELLRQQQRDLDRREAQWNARVAQWEQQQRACRLQLDQRRLDLDEREAHAARREAELARRTAALAAAEVAAEQAAETAKQLSDRRAADLDILMEHITQRERELQAEREQLRAAEHRLESSQKKWQQQITIEHQQVIAQRTAIQQQQRQVRENLERYRGELELRAARLEKPHLLAESQRSQPAEPVPATPVDISHELQRLEESLAHKSAELKRRLRSLEQDRELWIAERDLQRREFEEWMASQQQELHKRGERLNRQRASQRRMHELLNTARHEALQVHGETLELRLAVEQTLGSLSAFTDPHALSRALARGRGELAAHYAARRQELIDLLSQTNAAAQQLELRQRQFETSRQRWNSWLKTRQKNLELRAAQLASREREIQSQRARLRRAEIAEAIDRPVRDDGAKKNPLSRESSDGRGEDGKPAIVSRVTNS